MADQGARNLSGLSNKVPQVTLAFWVIKIMSTTVGETGADYLAVNVGAWHRNHRCHHDGASHCCARPAVSLRRIYPMGAIG